MASEYSVRTPSITRLRVTMEETLVSGVSADFEKLLEKFNELRGSGDSFNEVSIAILGAGNNELVAYDLTHWGEDVGLASRATFSSKKQVFENEESLR